MAKRSAKRPGTDDLSLEPVPSRQRIELALTALCEAHSLFVALNRQAISARDIRGIHMEPNVIRAVALRGSSLTSAAICSLDDDGFSVESIEKEIGDV